MAAPIDPVAHIGEVCPGFPDAVEKPFGGHSAPAFRIRDKLFVTTSQDGTQMWCKAGAGVQEALVGSDPQRMTAPKRVVARLDDLGPPRARPARRR